MDPLLELSKPSLRLLRLAVGASPGLLLFRRRRCYHLILELRTLDLELEANPHVTFFHSRLALPLRLFHRRRCCIVEVRTLHLPLEATPHIAFFHSRLSLLVDCCSSIAWCCFHLFVEVRTLHLRLVARQVVGTCIDLRLGLQTDRS